MIYNRSLFTYIFFIVSIGILIFNTSCANIGAPTGGPKDSLAPEAVLIKPLNYSTEFKGKKITITFNEYIKLTNISSQLIVSPPLKRKPETLVKGKSLIIELKDTLRENTTYTFNFGNAIVDITENNPIENFNYVFSTGSYIDSLSIKGKVINSFNDQPEKDALAILFIANDSSNIDSLPYTQLPSYFSKTDDNGNFEIKNLAPNSYKLFTLKDGNNNLKYDLPTEIIGFDNNLIRADYNNDTIYTIYSFTETLPFKFFNARHTNYGKIAFAFNQPEDSITIQKLNGNSSEKKAWELYSFSKEKDTLFYWSQEEIKDSLMFTISLAKTTLDTVVVKANDSYKKPKLLLKSNIATDLNIGDSLVINTSQPSISVNENKFLLIADSKDTLDVSINSNKSFKKHTVDFERKLGSQYILTVLPNAFTDIFETKNDTSVYSFRTKKVEDYGVLIINYTHSGSNQAIIELLDDKGELAKSYTVNGDKKITINNLPPKTYAVRVIEDINGNGKWDTGNYLLKLQPEKIQAFDDLIIIRANWDVDLVLKPSF